MEGRGVRSLAPPRAARAAAEQAGGEPVLRLRAERGRARRAGRGRRAVAARASQLRRPAINGDQRRRAAARGGGGAPRAAEPDRQRARGVAPQAAVAAARGPPALRARSTRRGRPARRRRRRPPPAPTRRSTARRPGCRRASSAAAAAWSPPPRRLPTKGIDAVGARSRGEAPPPARLPSGSTPSSPDWRRRTSPASDSPPLRTGLLWYGAAHRPPRRPRLYVPSHRRARHAWNWEWPPHPALARRGARSSAEWSDRPTAAAVAGGAPAALRLRPAFARAAALRRPMSAAAMRDRAGRGERPRRGGRVGAPQRLGLNAPLSQSSAGPRVVARAWSWHGARRRAGRRAQTARRFAQAAARPSCTAREEPSVSGQA